MEKVKRCDKVGSLLVSQAWYLPLDFVCAEGTLHVAVGESQEVLSD